MQISTLHQGNLYLHSLNLAKNPTVQLGDHHRARKPFICPHFLLIAREETFFSNISVT